MRLGHSKKRSSKDKGDKDGPQSLAAVAIQLGRYVSLQSQQFLQEIRESDKPVEEVKKRTIDDFANAGMPELTDSFQKKGAGRIWIERIREALT